MFVSFLLESSLLESSLLESFLLDLCQAFQFDSPDEFMWAELNKSVTRHKHPQMGECFNSVNK